MRLIAVVVLACLTGCAAFATHQELQEVGQRHTVTSTQPPRPMASCIARNALAQGFHVTVLESSAPGGYEVAISMPGLSYGQHTAVAVELDGKGGSAVTVHTTPLNFSPERHVKAISAGC